MRERITTKGTTEGGFGFLKFLFSPESRPPERSESLPGGWWLSSSTQHVSRTARQQVSSPAEASRVSRCPVSLSRGRRLSVLAALGEDGHSRFTSVEL